MTVKDLLLLRKGTKVMDIIGVFSRISAFKKTATGKIRQSAILQDNTGEISVTIWGGQIDKFLFGSTFKIKEAYIDEYQNLKRLTVNQGKDIELISHKTQLPPKEVKENSTTTTQIEAITGAIQPLTVSIASTDRQEIKNLMKECIEDIKDLVKDMPLTAENFVAMVDTLFIERNKRIRKERF